MPATTELKRLTGRQLAAETLSWYELFTVYFYSMDLAKIDVLMYDRYAIPGQRSIIPLITNDTISRDIESLEFFMLTKEVMELIKRQMLI